MAITTFQCTTYKGGSHDASARLAYMTRRPAHEVSAEARVLHQGLQAGGEVQREDLVAWDHANTPPWAQGDPVRFFTKAEQHESGHWVAYTEWRFALPRELSRDQQLAAGRDLLDAAFGTTHP